jgi:hypothetical protein
MFAQTLDDPGWHEYVIGAPGYACGVRTQLLPLQHWLLLGVQAWKAGTQTGAQIAALHCLPSLHVPLHCVCTVWEHCPVDAKQQAPVD